MTKEQAYTLWRTGEIPAPPQEHEAYCRVQARRDKIKLVKYECGIKIND